MRVKWCFRCACAQSSFCPGNGNGAPKTIPCVMVHGHWARKNHELMECPGCDQPPIAKSFFAGSAQNCRNICKWNGAASGALSSFLVARSKAGAGDRRPSRAPNCTGALRCTSLWTSGPPPSATLCPGTAPPFFILLRSPWPLLCHFPRCTCVQK